MLSEDAIATTAATLAAAHVACLLAGRTKPHSPESAKRNVMAVFKEYQDELRSEQPYDGDAPIC